MVYERKHGFVDARQHVGQKLTVVSQLKGEQVCNEGDFLVEDPIALQALRDQEVTEGLVPNALANRGTVYVIAEKDFLAEFDSLQEPPVLEPVIEPVLDPAVEPVVEPVVPPVA